MSFDRTKSADRVAMQNEITDDPNGQDYAAAQGVTAVILEKLNDPAQNVGSPDINRPAEELDIPDIAAVIDDTEYAALSEYSKVWVEMFINRPAEEPLKPHAGKFFAVFPLAGTTGTAAQELRSKKASRAETRWGVNTVISREDLIASGVL